MLPLQARLHHLHQANSAERRDKCSLHNVSDVDVRERTGARSPLYL